MESEWDGKGMAKFVRLRAKTYSCFKKCVIKRKVKFRN